MQVGEDGRNFDIKRIFNQPTGTNRLLGTFVRKFLDKFEGSSYFC